MSTSYRYRDPEIEDAREIVRGVAGLYVGQLDTEEMDAFQTGLEEGFARRDFNHAGGILGLAKVAYVESQP